MKAPVARVGIVGCGRIAGFKDRPRPAGPIGTHAQAYHRHPCFQIAAVVSQALAQAQRFQEIWAVPHAYPSVGELLTHEALEVISLCSPDDCHFPQAQEILQSPHRPRVLFIEKPVCLRPAELTSLLALSQQTGVAVLVNHTRRFDPAHRRAAHLAKSGDLGALVMGRGVYYGGWLNNGVHLIDSLRMCTEDEPTVISAAMAGAGKPGDPDLGVKLAIGEAEITLESFNEAYYQLFELELRFAAGRLRWFDFGSQIYPEKVRVNAIKERELKPLPGSPWRGLVSPLYEAVSSIDAHLQGKSRLAESGVDLIAAQGTMQIIWRAREMAQV
jgi:predicted dehydrogenase